MYTLLAHFSPAQTVPGRYLRQPPAPSHLPSVPHDGAPWSEQLLRVSLLPSAMGVHLPSDEGSAQLRQPPVQASAQQTPSTQLPDWHSVPTLQIWPFCLGPQVPFTQAIPATQSESLLQLELQAPFTQRKGGQFATPGSRQLPAPSQVPGVDSLSPVQAGGMQTVSAAYLAQAPNPSQVPVSPQPAAPVSLQIWWGSGLPRSMGQQVPSWPTRLHDTQSPWQATEQQTPSTQKPDAHSSFFAQTAAFILGPQLPFTHSTPLTQSVFLVQEGKQSFLAASHENGAQTLAAPGRQRPMPSQTLMPVTASPSH